MKKKDELKLGEIQRTLDNAKSDWKEYQRHDVSSMRRLESAIAFARAAYEKLGHCKGELGEEWGTRYTAVQKGHASQFLKNARNDILHNATAPKKGFSTHISAWNSNDNPPKPGERFLQTVIGEAATGNGNYQIVRTSDGKTEKRYFTIPASTTSTIMEDHEHTIHIVERDLPWFMDQVQSLLDDASRILR